MQIANDKNGNTIIQLTVKEYEEMAKYKDAVKEACGIMEDVKTDLVTMGGLLDMAEEVIKTTYDSFTQGLFVTTTPFLPKEIVIEKLKQTLELIQDGEEVENTQGQDEEDDEEDEDLDEDESLQGWKDAISNASRIIAEFLKQVSIGNIHVDSKIKLGMIADMKGFIEEVEALMADDEAVEAEKGDGVISTTDKMPSQEQISQWLAEMGERMTTLDDEQLNAFLKKAFPNSGICIREVPASSN